MNDNELDDLFRSNADYLADQPPRDFDKDAFWQQLQTAIPPKNDRPKKPLVWGWAAAMLLAGIFGSVWWMQSEGNGVENQKLAQKVENTPAMKSAERIARVPQKINHVVGNKKSQLSSPHISDTSTEKSIAKRRERLVQEVPSNSTQPENEPIILAIKEYSPPESVVEAPNPQPELVTPAVPEKPHYRVVHINEIRERKQQEAKARTRLAFRIGPPSGTRLTTQSDHSSPLSIPIQN